MHVCLQDRLIRLLAAAAATTCSIVEGLSCVAFIPSVVMHWAEGQLQLAPLRYGFLYGTQTLRTSSRLTKFFHWTPQLQAGGSLTASRATFFLQLGLRSAAAGNFPAALDR